MNMGLYPKSTDKEEEKENVKTKVFPVVSNTYLQSLKKNIMIKSFKLRIIPFFP